jgi:general secretion pathway protein G
MDPWGQPYKYMNEAGKPVVYTLGRDNQMGGEGEDQDISSKDTNTGK